MFSVWELNELFDPKTLLTDLMVGDIDTRNLREDPRLFQPCGMGDHHFILTLPKPVELPNFRGHRVFKLRRVVFYVIRPL